MWCTSRLQQKKQTTHALAEAALGRQNCSNRTISMGCDCRCRSQFHRQSQILPSIAVALDCNFFVTKSCHCCRRRSPKLRRVNIRGGWREVRLLALVAKLCRRQPQFCRRRTLPPLSSQAAKIALADPCDGKRRMVRRSSFGSLEKTCSNHGIGTQSDRRNERCWEPFVECLGMGLMNGQCWCQCDVINMSL